MNNTTSHTAVCRRITDIIRAANEKFWPEGVHPDTMGEIIAGELGLREQRGGPGDSTYDPAVYRFVSAYNRDMP